MNFIVVCWWNFAKIRKLFHGINHASKPFFQSILATTKRSFPLKTFHFKVHSFQNCFFHYCIFAKDRVVGYRTFQREWYLTFPFQHFVDYLLTFHGFFYELSYYILDFIYSSFLLSIPFSFFFLSSYKLSILDWNRVKPYNCFSNDKLCLILKWHYSSKSWRKEMKNCRRKMRNLELRFKLSELKMISLIVRHFKFEILL